MNDRRIASPVARLALVAVLTAVTALLTRVVQIYIPATKGYIHFGDVVIYFSAFTFGPFTACISGGVGTAIADLTSGGYAQWAPISLVVHGLQGLIVGLIATARVQEDDPSPGRVSLQWILAALAGTAILCGGYLLAQIFMVGFGRALVEVPMNVIQSLVGIIGGIPLTIAVRKAYPPVRNLHW